MFKGNAVFKVIGSGFVLDKAAKALKVRRPGFLSARSADTELIDVDNVKKKGFAFGRVSASGGRASLDYLDTAVDMLKRKQIDCLVTCPISKEAISLAGSVFTGHTEYLSAKFRSRHTLMMLVNKRLRFSLATRHIPLNRVSGKITPAGLKENILLTVEGLRSLFGISNPRIVVCGINPHASDNGLIGDDELKVISPAVAASRRACKGASITGPLPSDSAISMADRGRFDCVIALYHDQALIPLKLTDFDSGVNITLGLPFVRTSPLHGTAFDLAAKPASVNPNSLAAAIRLAIKCTLNLRRA
jgi:4-hydroxythreonine-4-phosphate dehydrogenase